MSATSVTDNVVNLKGETLVDNVVEGLEYILEDLRSGKIKATHATVVWYFEPDRRVGWEFAGPPLSSHLVVGTLESVKMQMMKVEFQEDAQ